MPMRSDIDSPANARPGASPSSRSSAFFMPGNDMPLPSPATVAAATSIQGAARNAMLNSATPSTTMLATMTPRRRASAPRRLATCEPASRPRLVPNRIAAAQAPECARPTADSISGT